MGDFIDLILNLFGGIDGVPTSLRQWAFVLTMMAAFYVLCFSITMVMESSAYGATLMETYQIAPKGLRITLIVSLVLIPLGASYGWASKFRL